MRIPYVIDNETAVLRDILRDVLATHAERSLDVATAYFTVGGFALLRNELKTVGSFRLLLGAEPASGEQVGLRPDARLTRGLMLHDLERLPFDESTLRNVEDLISWLRSDRVRVRLHDKGFLHAKAWLFYSDRPGRQMLFDRFRPILAIVGSSNFTAPGLTSNRELNLAHKVLLDESEAADAAAEQAVEWLSDARASETVTPQNRQLLKSEVGARAIIDLERWYQRQWDDGRDFKGELIELLDASKFGQKEYTPWQVYMKALFEYFRDDLGEEADGSTRSAVDLAEFQEDAVKKARRILSRYDGVMIADSVGLGKTWIGKKLLEHFAYHMRQKALVVCPAALRDMWETELRSASIAAAVLSQEELGREEFDWHQWTDTDFIVVDESHNFRNPNAQRFDALSSIIAANGGTGASGGRKKVVLLTATPVSNSVLDLYNQLTLITQNDRTFFAAAGIGDLYKLFLAARRDPRALPLYNLLEEVVIRRTRPFIRKAYPDATIRGEKISFPDRKLKTIQYDLEETYAGLYEEIVSGVEALRLAPYHLEAYKKTKTDEFEEGREQALVGIFKSRYLKRLESSVEAFRISIRRALQFLETFDSYLSEGRILKSSDFQKALRYISREDEEDDATVRSLADDMESKEEVKALLATMSTVDPAQYDRRHLHDDVRRDVEIFTTIYDRIRDIKPADDLKLQRLKDLLRNELRGKKVLIFTYYRDTARYLFRQLGAPESTDAMAFRAELGDVVIRRLDSGADSKDRLRTVQNFAPIANGRPELAGSADEIDLLISTDVLAEGQNLQDCGHLLNYDLHWNPTRMVQRAGRIDRIGSTFDVLWVNNMFPDAGLERLLRLVESLSQRIEDIDRLGLLDASVLGETVHPRNFNTLRRIRDEDGNVIEEEEQQTELISHEFLQQEVRELLKAGGDEMLSGLPDGIHSGLRRERSRGVFFYFQAGEGTTKQHFWRYVDLRDNSIVDNRYVIANLIACGQETPRVVEPDSWLRVFELQERAVESILQSAEQQVAMQAAPKVLDPVQQTIATILQQSLNRADIYRSDAIDSVRFLSRPVMKPKVRRLREMLRVYQNTQDVQRLLQSVKEIRTEIGVTGPNESAGARRVQREDLRLICFDFLSS
jgi:SNF2 family DNA or RNA helicase